MVQHIKKSQLGSSLVNLMAQESSSEYVLHSKHYDFEKMCEDVRAWNLDFRQLERGRFSGEVLQFGTGAVHIAEATFGRRLSQRGAPPAGLRTIAIPATPHQRLKWRGSEVSGSDLMIFPPGAELDSVSDERFHVYTCSFPEELLASICDQSRIAQLTTLQNGREVIRCSQKSVSLMQQLLRNATAKARSGSNAFEHANGEQPLISELPRLIIQGIAQSNGDSVPRVNARREIIVKTAVRFLEKFADQPITILDLVEEVSTSQRTLEYAFRECLGITPKAFLISYRFNQVRRQLRRSDPDDVKITDVANRWGLWHMGQFAADYRTFFGELPSETLLSIGRPK